MHCPAFAGVVGLFSDPVSLFLRLLCAGFERKTETKSDDAASAISRVLKGLKITMSVNYSSLRVFLSRFTGSGNVYCSFTVCFLLPESIKVWQYTYARPHVQSVSRARIVRACRPFVPFFSIWICARVLAGPFLLIWYFLRLYPDIFMANLLRVVLPPCAHVLIAGANRSWEILRLWRKEIFHGGIIAEVACENIP